MNVTLRLMVPDCNSCKRDEEPNDYFPINDINHRTLVSAGLYHGHPANMYNGLPATDAANLLGDVLTNLLAHPLRHMKSLQEDGGREGYERQVLDLKRFIESCRKYSTSTVEVKGN